MALTNGMDVDRDLQGSKISSGGRVVQMDMGQQNPSQFLQGPAQVREALLQSGEG